MDYESLCRLGLNHIAANSKIRRVTNKTYITVTNYGVIYTISACYICIRLALHPL
jgi:hypothetical protein